MNGEIPEWGLLTLTLLGLLVGATLSAAEAALERITRAAVAEMRPESRAQAVEMLLNRREDALGVVAFVRVLAEMTAAVCLTLAVADLLHVWWQILLVAVAVTALLLAVVVWLSPRRFGQRHPSGVLGVLHPVLSAFASVGASLARAWARVWPRSSRTDLEAREEREDDLRDMVDRVSESEEIEEDERELLQSVFRLGQTLTREVMVPRTDMVTIDADESLSRAMRLFTKSGYSRVPVVGGSTDDLLGVLYLKDILGRLHRSERADGLTARDVMREPTFVPETKPVDDLLREMQAGSVHIAVVVDEYGGIAGLVTIEDLLEELVGEMVDEHDVGELEVEEVGEGRYRVPARMPADEVGELFGLEISDDDVDSVGGLLAKTLGKVPLAGAQADVLGLHLVAERVEGRRRRVSTLLVSRAAVTQDNGEA